MTPLPARAHFRDRRNFAMAVGSELAAPALRLIARSLSRGGPTSPREWRRALIVGHGHIGDVLCQTVSLDALANRLPGCQFDYLTTSLAAEVLSGNSAIERVLPWNIGSRPTSLAHDHIRALRKADYDAILCTNVVRHQDALRLALSLRIPNRVAFVHRGLSGLVTLPVRLQYPMTPPAQSRAMVETITGASDNSELRPRVFLSDANIAEGASEWNRLGFGRDELVVACAVTTRQRIGTVPPEFFTNVLRALRSRAPDARIVLTGSGDDLPILNGIAESIGAPIAVSAGRTGLMAFASFLSRCNALFCMDSGPRHLANAVGTPVVFTRNPAVRAAEAGAYCATEVDLVPPGDFLAAGEARRMIDRISTEDAAATILRSCSVG
jgi:ADP-heptose:LPS heptosyltransferase